MMQHSDLNVLVAGGTGNVGTFIVRGLLERGANVVVPSRSERKIDDLRTHLTERAGLTDLGRLRTLTGEIGRLPDAERMRERILETWGPPNAVVASLGRLVLAQSMIDAAVEDLQRALDGYVFAHFVVARTFLPLLRASGGTYVFINGFLAFAPRPGWGTGIVSTATAAQHMLFRSLAQELDESPARVIELVNHAFIREHRTQPGSVLRGEDVGAYVAHLLAAHGDGEHGRSIHLQSPEQLAEVSAPE